MKNYFWPLLAFATIAMGSCSKDDGYAPDPQGTVSLNMLNVQNGKTLLGNSGIYIDNAQNFVADDDCLLFVLGKSSGLGAVTVNSFDTPTSQAAVQAGYGYAAVRPDAMMKFPSGKLALPIGNNQVNYLKFYAVSSLIQENKTIGAAVKYALIYPETYGLPESGSTVLTIDTQNYSHLGQEVWMTLPSADCEYKFLDNNYGIRCEQRGRNLVFWLEDWFSGRFELYLRLYGSYTKTYVEVQHNR